MNFKLLFLAFLFYSTANVMAEKETKFRPLSSRLEVIYLRVNSAIDEAKDEDAWVDVKSLKEELVIIISGIDGLISNSKKSYLSKGTPMSDRAFIEFRQEFKTILSMAIAQINLWDLSMNRVELKGELEDIKKLTESAKAIDKEMNSRINQ